jgi:hypothetical protein
MEAKLLIPAARYGSVREALGNRYPYRDLMNGLAVVLDGPVRGTYDRA